MNECWADLRGRSQSFPRVRDPMAFRASKGRGRLIEKSAPPPVVDEAPWKASREPQDAPALGAGEAGHTAAYCADTAPVPGRLLSQASLAVSVASTPSSCCLRGSGVFILPMHLLRRQTVLRA